MDGILQNIDQHYASVAKIVDGISTKFDFVSYSMEEYQRVCRSELAKLQRKYEEDFKSMKQEVQVRRAEFIKVEKSLEDGRQEFRSEQARIENSLKERRQEIRTEQTKIEKLELALKDLSSTVDNHVAQLDDIKKALEALRFGQITNLLLGAFSCGLVLLLCIYLMFKHLITRTVGNHVNMNDPVAFRHDRVYLRAPIPLAAEQM